MVSVPSSKLEETDAFYLHFPSQLCDFASTVAALTVSGFVVLPDSRLAVFSQPVTRGGIPPA